MNLSPVLTEKENKNMGWYLRVTDRISKEGFSSYGKSHNMFLCFGGCGSKEGIWTCPGGKKYQSKGEGIESYESN